MIMQNIFQAIPDNLTTEVSEILAQSDQVRIERIISKGHQSPQSGWYDQEQTEWVMVLAGEAILLFEDGSRITMNTGDFITIPRHRKHKVVWTAPDIETIWLAVHF